ncbi:MAG: type II secretion system protein [Brachyspira sp.]|nr:type II secretion system protein [Brachyspira sp.]
MISIVLRGGGRLSFLSGQGFTHICHPELVSGSKFVRIRSGNTSTLPLGEGGRSPGEGISLSRKFGFTLAEVLITLAIIGIVAAMTLPALIQKQNEKAAVTALKKFYSSVSQAYIFAKNEYGTPDGWYGGYMAKGSPQGSNIMVDIMTKYMKTSKICHNDKGCFKDITYKKIDGKNSDNFNSMTDISKLITSDGMSVFMYTYGSSPDVTGGGFQNESYGAISVDINGFKGPNVFGQDMFSFILTKEGIYPFGSPSSIQDETLEDSSVIKIYSFPRACNRKDCYGLCEGCTAWVLLNENMDYLHCDDLSWNGKTKCK